MKKFIYTTALFLLPILLLHLFMYLFYTYEKGDLIRTAYLVDFYPNYRDNFKSNEEVDTLYDYFEEVFEDRSAIQVLTIGDSFSYKGSLGYQNYLAPYFDVVHFNKKSIDPLQKLSSLVNGDFFDHYQVDYVILESVERSAVLRSERIKIKKKLDFKDIRNQIIIDQEKGNQGKADYGYKFPSKRIFSIPYNSLVYSFVDQYQFEDRVNFTKLDQGTFFSTHSEDFLFVNSDVNALSRNNDVRQVEGLNLVLNNLAQKLKQKGVQLVVFIAPDKYDLYYDHLKFREDYEKPLFFDILKRLEKDYLYVDSKAVLESYLGKKKDLYYYDDTHWSPVGAELIAEELKDVIGN